MAAVPKYKKLFKLFKTDIQPGISADDQVRFECIQSTKYMYPKYMYLSFKYIRSTCAREDCLGIN